jgi:hypothetical protein
MGSIFKVHAAKEASVTSYQSKLRHTPEDRRSHLQSSGSLKPLINVTDVNFQIWNLRVYSYLREYKAYFTRLRTGFSTQKSLPLEKLFWDV